MVGRGEEVIQEIGYVTTLQYGKRKSGFKSSL